MDKGSTKKEYYFSSKIATQVASANNSYLYTNLLAVCMLIIHNRCLTVNFQYSNEIIALSSKSRFIPENNKRYLHLILTPKVSMENESYASSCPSVPSNCYTLFLINTAVTLYHASTWRAPVLTFRRSIPSFMINAKEL